MFQTLYHIGRRDIIYHDLEVDIDDDDIETQLEEGQQISAQRILYFDLIKEMVSEDQRQFVEKIREHHPTLQDAKVKYAMIWYFI